MRSVGAPLGTLVCLVAMAQPARAQRVALEALAEVEVWKTDAGSRLLARDEGRLAAEGRVHAWAALRAAPSLELLALGYVEGGRAEAKRSDAELDLLTARWFPSRALILEGGKILLPMGEFGPRRFSNTNPLIGVPDTYPALYPWGASVSGVVGPFDYLLAVVSLPAVNTRYSPKPAHRLRPAVSAGFSAGPVVRVGASLTRGPYLGPGVGAALPVGAAWTGFTQTVATCDVRVSAGYVETRAELAWSSYKVPTVSSPVRGLGWYAETRVTLSPRVFAAVRLERNRYAFVQPVSPTFWVGTATTEMNGEAGGGYRFSPALLLKASLRLDHWPVHSSGRVTFPDGYAVAVQLSYHVSASDLLPRP